MLVQPGLRRFVVIPLMANIAVFVLIAGSLYQLMSGFYIDITGDITGTLGFLTWIVTPIIWLVGTLLSGYLSIFIVLFLTSPFHGLLAEKVEEQVTGEAIQNESSVVQVALSVPRGFLRELQKLFHYLPMAVLALLTTPWTTIDSHSGKSGKPAVLNGVHRSALGRSSRLYRESQYSISRLSPQR